jgi:amidophosphoribosyltransferase
MIKEECGVFGIFGLSESSRYVYLGLTVLQHRGQESCGIVSSDGSFLYKQVGLGRVSDFFDETKLSYLQGYSSIGHVRYSTTGSPTLVNAQPITASVSKGAIAIAHNGNITNANTIRNELMEKGMSFQSSSDSEVIIQLIAGAPCDNLVESVKWALEKLEGSFSILVLSKDMLIAARDPMGFRPLSMGKIGTNIPEMGDTIVFASEDSAFAIAEAVKIRDVNPNEIVVITERGTQSLKITEKTVKQNHCVFELIYFSKPSSKVFDKSVYNYRFDIGRKLAREHPVQADYIIPVPDSGMVSALGYSHESKIPLALGLIRSHYIGRTFIEPSQKIRDFGVKMKFIPVREIIEGKRVVLIDDSIVRGTTSRKIVSLVRSCSPKEVHFRVASPPVRYPCYYGIDFSTYEELLANKTGSTEEIAKFIGAESVGYISSEGLFDDDALSINYCKACFDGDFPTPISAITKGGFENEIRQNAF